MVTFRHRPPRAVVYVRVSTRAQARNGDSMAGQRRTCEAEMRRNRWEHYATREDVVSGGAPIGDRPGLTQALADIESGEADILIATKLDRVSRSVMAFGELVERVRAAGGAVVVLDPAIDLTTENGEMVANVLMALAQWERRTIARRVREAFDEQRAASPTGHTNHRRMDPTLRARLRRFRTAGKSDGDIAGMLNREGVPTVRGGTRWTATTVRRAIEWEEAS